MEQFFEEYEDANLYDKENTGVGEIPFLKELALQMNGPIIDLACGTGRLTIPLAKEGHEMIGIDVHEGMLQAAKEKSHQENLHINWVRQDCTNFDLGIKTDFIYSGGNSFQHFLTNEDQDGLFNSVSSHLNPLGLFVFDTRFPSAEELLQPPREEYWTSYIDADTGYKVELSTISHYIAIEQVQYYTTFRRYVNEGQLMKELKARVNLRYVYPKEMERLAEKHGFKIINVYEDWNRNPISQESYAMVYVCQKL